MGKNLLLCSAVSIFVCCTFTFAQTPVEKHGRLQVQGNRIVGEHGNPVQLRGMSLFWPIRNWGGQHFFTDNAINDLVDNWKVDLVRAPIAARTMDGLVGYMVDRDRETQLGLMRTVVNAAIRRGIYVIVDFHAYDQTGETDEIIQGAKEFFTTVATEYGHHPNIIYETLNEPIGMGNLHQYWADDIKPYHEQVIAAIRPIDPHNLIVAGTPTWSQRVDIAAANPIDDKNVAYSLHFYAASHGNTQRGYAQNALDSGAAIFVTEWGTVTHTGDGAINLSSTRTWLAFMDQNQISWANWSLINNFRSSSALVTSALPHGNWGDEMLTASGKFIRDTLRAYHETVSVANKTIQSNNSSIGLVTTPKGLTLSLPREHGFRSYELFRIDGRIARRGSVGGVGELELSDLSKGVWFVRLVGKREAEVVSAVIGR